MPVNALQSLLFLQPWKPVLTALLLPPVPFLVLILLGAGLLARGRRRGWWLVLPAVMALWVGSTVVAANLVSRGLGLDPTPLSAERRAAIGQQVRAAPATPPAVAIVVLGGGRKLLAPELGLPDLSPDSLERLRFGMQLARETGAPLAFSGGTGWGQPAGTPEADVAARIATLEYGLPLRWSENRSRDTRENARLTIPMLRAEGITRVLLVTHGWHMARALRAFEEAAAGELVIEAAPMGLSDHGPLNLVDWMPSGTGHTRLRQALREWIGWWWGA